MSDNLPAASDEHPTSAETAAPATSHPFTADESRQFLADDIHAAKVVSGLMSIIFVLGLVLYTVVLWTTL